MILDSDSMSSSNNAYSRTNAGRRRKKKCGSEKFWFMGIRTVDGWCNLLMYSSQYTGTVTTMILDSDSMSSSNNAHSRTNAGRRREKNVAVRKCGSWVYPRLMGVATCACIVRSILGWCGLMVCLLNGITWHCTRLREHNFTMLFLLRGERFNVKICFETLKL